MMQKEIQSIVNAVSATSETAIEKIVTLAESIQYEKGELITTVGMKNHHEYFVLDGICHSYLSSPEGENITISFFMSESIISPSTTRNQLGHSLINIKALTAVTVVAINATEFEKLMIDDLEIREFGNSVLRNELLEKVQKEISLASYKAKDRLLLLRKKFPMLENKIPHAAIASYLGITTISLSRLRTQS
jgi:CRP-like cAMP-binding protein